MRHPKISADHFLTRQWSDCGRAALKPKVEPLCLGIEMDEVIQELRCLPTLSVFPAGAIYRMKERCDSFDWDRQDVIDPMRFKYDKAARRHLWPCRFWRVSHSE